MGTGTCVDGPCGAREESGWAASGRVPSCVLPVCVAQVAAGPDEFGRCGSRCDQAARTGVECPLSGDVIPLKVSIEARYDAASDRDSST